MTNNICYYCMRETMQGNTCTSCGRRASAYVPGRDFWLAPGTTIDDGNVIIGEKLGRGGFGLTYVGFDKESGQRVALKEYYPYKYVSRERDGKTVCSGLDERSQRVFTDSLRRFKRESRIIYSLREHPHIVKVAFGCEDNGTAYYGMEMLEGESLSAWLDRQEGRKVSARRAFRLLDPIMDALQYCHDHRVLHRDVKPNNIFLCSGQWGPGKVFPKLIDFGAAFTDQQGFTVTAGANVQSPGYSPPEQVNRSGDYGPWVDVYAVAATYYEMVVGEPPAPPYDRDGATPLMIVPPRQKGADISQRVEDVIMHGLARSWRERIGSMQALREELAAALEADVRIIEKKKADSEKDRIKWEDEGDAGNEWPQQQGAAQQIGAPQGMPVPALNKAPQDAFDAQVQRAGGVHAQLRPADKRVKAYLIDAVLLFLPLLFIREKSALALGWLLMAAVSFVLSLDSPGATLGMRAMGLRFFTHGRGEVSLAGALIFSALRAALPFALLDTLITEAGVKGGETFAEKLSHLTIVDPKAVCAPAAGSAQQAAPVSSAVLRCIEGPKRGLDFAVTNGVQAGRTCLIQLDEHNDKASRVHCTFTFENGIWILTNHSGNGTKVNEADVNVENPRMPLRSGDIVQMGIERFIFIIEE